MPVQTTLKIYNKKVMLGLKKFGDAMPKIADAEMKKAVTGARDEVSHEPPELPNQKYIRTHRYHYSWKVTKNKAKSYTLKSSGVKYAPYVGGKVDGTGQAMIHAGRWIRVSDAMQRAARKFIVQMKERIKRAIREAGMGL